MFDSGSGGLSVLSELRQSLPQADVLYFGDIKNAPYGGKSQAELTKLTYKALSILKDRGVNNIVSACNSVSASLAISLFDTLAPEQKIIEMVGPTVVAFKDKKQRIAICATEATIHSGMYENGLRMVGQENIINIPIPDLAGQIEFGASKEDMLISIEKALSPHLDKFDVCVLACTHYPLVKDLFEQVLGDSAEIFDPATAVADRAKQYYKSKERGDGQVTFVLSQDSKHFRDHVDRLFPVLNYTIEIL